MKFGQRKLADRDTVQDVARNVMSPPTRDFPPAKPRQTDLEEFAPVYNQTNDDPLKVGGPLPPSMGRCADLYSDVRALRLQMDKEVDAVKAREAEIREWIINNLSKSDDTGASGLRYRAQIVMKDIPRPANWEAIHKFVQESGRFDLLQRRLGEKAVKDMLDAGEQIPGVEVVHVPEVSITKI